MMTKLYQGISALALDFGTVIAVIGIIIGIVGLFFARRADKRLGNLWAAYGEFVNLTVQKVATTSVVEPSRLDTSAATVGVPSTTSSSPRVSRDKAPPQTQSVVERSTYADTSNRFVGAYDVTNDSQSNFLVQTSDSSRHQARLSILGIREHEPVALSAALSNNTGLNFVVEDFDKDGRVEICTVDRVDGAFKLSAYRWNGDEFRAVPLKTTSALGDDDINRFMGSPPWAASS